MTVKGNSTQDNKKKDVQTKKIQVKVNNTSQPTPAIGNASGQGRQHRKDVEKLGRNPRTEWGLETTVSFLSSLLSTQ